MSFSDPGSDQAFHLRRAKDYYDKVKGSAHTAKLQLALANFKYVVTHCACNEALLESSQAIGLRARDIPMPTCHCKDFVSLAANPGEDGEDGLAMYRLATKPCNCGSGISLCTYPAHIAGLDGMSAVCEATKDFAQAIQYASLMIIVAPHAPEGYLRLVKDLRLQARSTRTDVTSQCMYILSQAAGSVRVFGDKNHEKLKAVRQMLRSDPMVRLPVEVRQMILQYLPSRDLCRVLAVSKKWNMTCRTAALWMHLDFEKHWGPTKGRSLRDPRPFRPGVLNDIICGRSQNLAKSLTINGSYDFGINDTTFRSMLRALPRLESLSLSGAKLTRKQREHDAHPMLLGHLQALSLDRVMNIIFDEAPAGLKALRLDYLLHLRPQPGHVFSRTIGRISESLEELTLTDLLDHTNSQSDNMMSYMFKDTTWPRLTKLTIDTLSSARLPIAHFARMFPNLKDLTLNRFHYIDEGITDPDLMGNLERLSVGDYSSADIPLASPKLRSIELLTGCVGSYNGLFIMHSAFPRSATNVWFANLEHLCLLCGSKGRWSRRSYWLLHPSKYFERIKPSCINGTLRSLHVSFNAPARDGLDGVLNKPAIHTLSCHDIAVRFGSVDCLDYDDFLEWVDTFPGLQTLGVFAAKEDCKSTASVRDPAWTLIARLLKSRPDIKTIYTDALSGAPRDEILGHAAKIGVDVIHAKRVPEPVLSPVATGPGPASQPEATQNNGEGTQNV